MKILKFRDSLKQTTEGTEMKVYMFVVLFLIIAGLACGCATTTAVAPQANAVIGEPHGIVNHCNDSRLIVIDQHLQVAVPANTAKEFVLANGKHQLDFYQMMPEGPKYYASWTYEVLSGEWLIVEMFPAE